MRPLYAEDTSETEECEPIYRLEVWDNNEIRWLNWENFKAVASHTRNVDSTIHYSFDGLFTAIFAKNDFIFDNYPYGFSD